jgi:hypothetical protein
MKLHFPVICITLLLALASHAQSNCPTAGNHERWGVKTSAEASPPIDVSLDTLIQLEKPLKEEAQAFRLGKRTGLIPESFNSTFEGKPISLKEGQIIRLEGWLHLVNYDSGDSDYHLQLTSDAAACPTDKSPGCVIVEIPFDACASESSEAKRWAFRASREMIDHKFVGLPAQQNLRKGATASDSDHKGDIPVKPRHVEVQGQLFFDTSHYPSDGNPGGGRGKSGCSALGVWEIHPVTAIVALDDQGNAVASSHSFMPKRIRKPLAELTRHPVR